MTPRSPLHLKPHVRSLNVGPGQLCSLYSLDFFLPRHYLRRTSAGREARDELIQLRNLLFAHGIARFDSGAYLRLGEHHIVVPARIHDDGLVVDIGDMRADAIQKMAVV